METITREKKERPPREPMLTKTTLRERGWTGALLRRFLPEPDEEKVNPHYKCAAPMQLYLVTRVEAAEGTAEFKAMQEKLASRRAGARKSVETKRKKTEAYVATVCFDVPLLEWVVNEAQKEGKGPTFFQEWLERNGFVQEKKP